MKLYLIKWSNGSFAVAGGHDLYDLFSVVDEIGDPLCGSYCRLPSTPFIWDSESGWDDRRELKPRAWTTGTELFKEICQAEPQLGRVL